MEESCMEKIEYDYVSPLAPYMKAYIAEYESQGKNPKMVEFILRTFDQHLVKINYRSGQLISEEIYRGWWSRWNNLKQTTSYHAAAYLSMFLRYLCSCGAHCYVPRLPNPGKNKSFVPYIFSYDEMSRIFKECDDWRDVVYTKDSHQLVMPAILRLLYSTGVRISEALKIENRDVLFDKHCIIIRNTKNNCDRLAPINESLEIVLREYMKNRNRIRKKGIEDPSSPLFVKANGAGCNSETILLRFKAICRNAGIEHQQEIHGVRIHDLRHTACVHALIKMVNSGKDPYCCLPSLAVYMGHYDVHSTEYYLRLAQMAYPDIINLTEPLSCSLDDIINNAVNFQKNGTV